MATQVGRGGGGKDVTDGKSHAGRSGAHDNAMGGGSRGGVGGGMGSFGGLPGQPTRDMFQKQDLMGARVSQALDDYRGVGDSFWDRVGSFLAGAWGLSETDPTLRGFSGPGMPGITGRANWGLDPLAAAINMGGMATGYPLGMAYQGIKSLTGWRGPEIGLGPEVFGGGSRPAPSQRGAPGMSGDGRFGGANRIATSGPRPSSGASIPDWFTPRFDDPRLARAYQNGSRFGHSGNDPRYQQALAEAIRQWNSYLLRTAEAKLPKARASAQASTVPAATLSDGVAGLAPYSVAKPGYAKASGYGGTSRAVPTGYTTPYA